MKKNLHSILFFCCLFFGANSMAQDYLTTHQFITTEDGLSNSLVNVAYQDTKGFLWISTGKGVDRYDGQEFEHISAQFDREVFENIYQIHEDVHGSIWMLTTFLRAIDEVQVFGFSKKIIYDPTSNSVQTFDQKFPDCPFDFANVTRIFQGKNRVLGFVLSNGQVWFYDGSFIKIFEDKSHNQLMEVVPSLKGTFWLNAKDQILEVDREGRVLQRDTFEYHCSTLFEASDTTLWFRYRMEQESSKPFFYNKKSNQKATPFFKTGKYDWLEESTGMVKEDKQGQIWYFTNDNIAVFDRSGNLLHDLKDEVEYIVYSIRNSFLCFTSESLILISRKIDDEGLLSIEMKKNSFKKYLLGAVKQISIRGIVKLNDSTLHVNNYAKTTDLNINDGSLKEWEYPFAHIYTYGLTKDNKGNIFSGGHWDKIIRSDTLGQYLGTYDLDPSIPDSLGVRALIIPFADKDNNLWLGGLHGLLYLDTITNVVKVFDQINGFDALKKMTIAHFYENEEGIWISTSNGIYLLDPLKGIVEYHNNFPSNNITFIHEDEQGVFWLGTSDTGLIKWDRKNDTIENFNERDGLSNNTIHGIFEDENEKLWMSSNFGLMRFDKLSKEINSFFEEDGITHNEFNKCAYFQDDDGTIYFGGLNGITAFHPSDFDLGPETKILKPIVTKFEKTEASSGKIVDRTQLFFSQNEINIYPEDKSFIIKFALLSFAHAHQQKYAYRLDGLEESWTSIKENFIRINRLPYGKFKLQIKGIAKNGAWSDELIIPVNVIKPFYLKPWFILLGVLGGIFLIWSFIRYRTYRLRMQAEKLAIEVFNRTKTIENQKRELEKSNRFKDRFLALMGHDLKTPLISLRGMAEKLNFLIQEKRYEDIIKLSASIDQSSSSMTRLLDNMLNWALLQKKQFAPKPELLNLNVQINEVIRLYKSIAILKNIDFQTEIPNHLSVFIDKNALLTVLRNLIDNAIKFSPQNGKITLYAKVKGDQIKIQIENFGQAIKPKVIQNTFNSAKPLPNEKGSGLGLLICKEFIEMNNGVFEIESINNQSTRASLFLPGSSVVANT